MLIIYMDGHYNNKLCTTLLDKTDYVVHSRNLKYYLKQGLKLTKVSRVIAFDQDDYMKKYIEHNTNMRTKAKSDFEKDFFKLMNNSVFGKSMENDSFFVELKKDPYKIIKDNNKEFDTSDYNKDHECYNLTNKKVIGKFKDELNGIPLEEYCGLRSKLYSYTYANKNPVRCKGIKKSVVDKTINMTDLKKCLLKM